MSKEVDIICGQTDAYATRYGPRKGQTPERRDPNMTIDEIKRKVAEDFASDNVTPDEVIVKDDGEIVIDRRRKIPWATPFAVGRVR